MHPGRLRHREDAGNRHFQPAIANATQYALHAILPGDRAGIDMAEMEAREGLRARQDALANVLERLPFRFADADNVAELAHNVEGTIEHRRAERVDGKINAAPI